MGNRLIAEYRPQEDKYYYYTSDQINSTSIVTNDSGTVVYSAAYDPYGGVQKTWVNTYNPALKFSGKERDTESGLDYFGARYYDKAQYRFISVDPVSASMGMIHDPQLLNLYSYCRNNPLNYFDPDGRKLIPVILPGIGFTFLDDKFYPVLREFMDEAKNKFKIDILIYDAYRTPEAQKILKELFPDKTATDISKHTLGFAVDIVMNGLTKDQLEDLVDLANSLGMRWSGDFKNYKGKNHFDIWPSGDLKELQEEAWEEWRKFWDEHIKTIHAYMTIYELCTDPFFLYGTYEY